MAYLGNRPATGENNAFRILDDISSHVVSFNGSSASVVSVSADTITIAGSEHRYITGQRVTYSKGGGTVITGLTDATAYYVIRDSDTTIQLATTASNATNSVAVNLTGLGAGTAHTLTLAFDGTNTKFKPTYNDGAQNPIITRAAQLVISLNGIIQQPIDSASPSTGFGIDVSGNIIFSTAPDANDDFWGHVHASNTVTFDISDNDIDNFTGDGSTVNFNLSKTPPDNRNILVTLDGVIQYPSDNSNTRAYTLSENELQFVSAPASGVAIQVRHIGFAGPTAGGGGGVTGFYGRTGNVVLKNTDNPVIGNLTAVDAAFSGNVSIAKTLTYMDVAHVDAVGIITAQAGIQCLDDLNVGLGTFFVDKSTGRVGIGTINPSEKLHISALGASDEPTIKVSGENSSIWLRTAGSSGSFPTGGSGNDGELIYFGGDFRFGVGTASKNVIFFNGNGYNEAMRIDSSRRLLIGHNASRDIFKQTGVQISGNTTDNAGLSIYSTYNGNGGPNLVLGHSRNGNKVTDGTILGDITFVGHDNTDLNSRASIIRSKMTADGADDSLYADLIFYTKRNAGGYPDESLRIDSSGKLLLGTSTAGAAQCDTFTLETNGHTGMTMFSGTSNRGTIAFGDGRSGNAQYRGVIMYDHSDDSMRLVTADAEKLRITSSGKTIISSPSAVAQTPAAILDVFNQGTTTQALRVYRNDLNDNTLAAFQSYHNALGIVDKMVITSRGRVGINTNNPQREIHVKPWDNNPATAAPGYIRIDSQGSDQAAILELYHTRGNGSDKWPSSVASVDGGLTLNVATGNNGSPQERLRIESTGAMRLKSEYLRFWAAAQTSSDFSQKVGLKWTYETDATTVAKIDVSRPSWSGGPSDILFHTTNTSGNLLERLRIDNEGIIWANKANPVSSSLIILDKDGSGEAALRFYNAGSNKAQIALDSDEHLTFDVNGGEKLRIDSSGCVRVGNTATQSTSGNTKRIALGAKGGIQGWVSGQLNGLIQLTDNYYWDGSNNKAIEADHCAYLSLRSGTLRFGSTNSSQTAGQNVSGGIHERLRITSDGKLLLKKTSSNWGTTASNTVIQLENSAIWDYAGVQFDVGHNYYYNSSGAYKYIRSGYAARQTFHNNTGDIAFWSGGTGSADATFTWAERLRIKATGNVGIGTDNPRGQFVVQSTKNALVNANCNDPHHFHLSLKNTDEQNTAIGLCFSHDSTVDRVGAAIIHNRSGNGSVGDMRFYTSPSEGTTTERLRITSVGINVWGNSNTFYGGGSGSDLNGDIRIRSTGSAVYQNLSFTSSDGTNTGSIVGYYGGAVMFFNSTQYVWSINSQGERLELTNTALSPRTTSTVLDLGTTTKRYRRTHTDAITVNTTNTNTKFCINGASSANVMTIRNTTGGNGNVGILFSTQDHSGGREKAAIYHQETHGEAHYGGDFIFCLNTATGGATQVSPSDERMRITRQGWVFLGKSSNAVNTTGVELSSNGNNTFTRNGNTVMTVNRGTNNGVVVSLQRSGNEGGTINITPSSCTYNSGSDYRRKENDVVISDGITKLKQLRPIRFNFKDEPDKTVDGFFAHEVQTVIPEIVTGIKDAVVTQDDIDNGDYKESQKDDPKYQSMDYSKLTPLLTAALQEAIAEIESLKVKVAALESS